MVIGTQRSNPCKLLQVKHPRMLSFRYKIYIHLLYQLSTQHPTSPSNRQLHHLTRGWRNALTLIKNMIYSQTPSPNIIPRPPIRRRRPTSQTPKPAQITQDIPRVIHLLVTPIPRCRSILGVPNREGRGVGAHSRADGTRVAESLVADAGKVLVGCVDGVDGDSVDGSLERWDCCVIEVVAGYTDGCGDAFDASGGGGEGREGEGGEDGECVGYFGGGGHAAGWEEELGGKDQISIDTDAIDGWEGSWGRF